MIRMVYSAFTLVVAAGIFVIVGSSVLSREKTPVISPLPDGIVTISLSPSQTTTPTPQITLRPSPSPQSSLSLGSVITQSLSGSKGTYAIVVKHIDRGEVYSYNADREFPTASLYKLWVMATAYDAIQKGSLSLEERLSSSVAGLNAAFNISPEYAELTEGSISLTVNQTLSQMITISHNYAALLLTKRISVSSVMEFLSSHGLSHSHTGEPPVSTARDISRFYELLMQDKLVEHTYSEAMIDLLKKQKLNGKLPKYLPETIEVAHKTGELDYFSHDAGIVFGKNGPYIIVVLSETNNPPAANERIASISEAVYTYFER